MHPQRAPRIALLTNVIAPYRVPIYEALASAFDLHVLYSGNEDNRGSWAGADALVNAATVKQSRGLSFKVQHGDDVGVVDERYLHFTFGYLSDLVRVRPDGVISMEMGFRTLSALLYCRLFGKPLWVWWGGTLHTERHIGQHRRTLRRLLAPRIGRWFAYGQASSEYLRSLAVPSRRIVRVQNCIDESQYTRRVPPAFDLTPRPVVMYVGRLVRRKGLDLLLETAADLEHEGLVFSLVLVGDGPERATLLRQSRSQNLTQVHFFPEVPSHQMEAVYRSADVVVLPSLEDPWGLVVNEAMWSGTSVLASIYAGCAGEILSAEHTFDPLNRTEFYTKLRQAVCDGLPPPDLCRLERSADVAQTVVSDVARVLGERKQTSAAAGVERA